MKIDYWSEEFRDAVEAAGFDSVEDAIKAVSKVNVEGVQDVLEGAVETDIPLAIWLLAGKVKKETGIAIEAIRKDVAGSWRTSSGDIPSYHATMAVLLKDMSPEEAGISWVEAPAWFFGTTKNPVIIETALKMMGYKDAMAGSPNWVMVAYVGKESEIDLEYAEEERKFREELRRFHEGEE